MYFPSTGKIWSPLQLYSLEFGCGGGWTSLASLAEMNKVDWKIHPQRNNPVFSTAKWKNYETATVDGKYLADCVIYRASVTKENGTVNTVTPKCIEPLWSSTSCGLVCCYQWQCLYSSFWPMGTEMQETRS